jgi:hypothetical protein
MAAAWLWWLQLAALAVVRQAHHRRERPTNSDPLAHPGEFRGSVPAFLIHPLEICAI